MAVRLPKNITFLHDSDNSWSTDVAQKNANYIRNLRSTANYTNIAFSVLLQHILKKVQDSLLANMIRDLMIQIHNILSQLQMIISVVE